MDSGPKGEESAIGSEAIGFLVEAPIKTRPDETAEGPTSNLPRSCS